MYCLDISVPGSHPPDCVEIKVYVHVESTNVSQ